MWRNRSSSTTRPTEPTRAIPTVSRSTGTTTTRSRPSRCWRLPSCRTGSRGRWRRGREQGHPQRVGVGAGWRRADRCDRKRGGGADAGAAGRDARPRRGRERVPAGLPDGSVGARALSTARPLAGPALVAAAFATLTAWSWGRWPDVLVDFGNSLYVAWQLAEGHTLYTDIAYKEGPLSMYALAGLFRFVGPSFDALVGANLALLALLTALIHGIFARACDRFTAALVSLLFLGVFAFSQYVGIGNYYYVCPYTPEQPHGVLLGVATIAALERAAARSSSSWAALAGLCCGLLALTKLELFVPGAAAAALGLALLIARPAPTLRARLALPAAFGAAALATVFAAVAALLAQMPAGEVLRVLGANWGFFRVVADDPFYLRGMGLDDPLRNLARSLRGLAPIALSVLGAVAASAWFPASTRGRRLACAGAGAALFLAALLGPPGPIGWRGVARALPWTSAAACAGLVVACVRRRGDPAGQTRFYALALWSVFATLLLIKMWLNARVSHYGFAMAMPAALLLAAILVWGVPARLRAASRDGTLARALLAALVLASIANHLRWAQSFYAYKTLPVGPAGDRFLAPTVEFDARGWVMAAAAERLRALIAPGETLLALPEGTLLNYWLRAPSPSRYTAFTPMMVGYFGEAAMLRDLEARPPDWIALVARDPGDFGTGRFGEDPRWGLAIMEWVRQRYEPVARVGVTPDCDGCFDVELLRRRSSSAR